MRNISYIICFCHIKINYTFFFVFKVSFCGFWRWVAETSFSVLKSQAGMPVLHWGGEVFICKFYKRLLLIFIWLETRHYIPFFLFIFPWHCRGIVVAFWYEVWYCIKRFVVWHTYELYLCNIWNKNKEVIECGACGGKEEGSWFIIVVRGW